MPRWNLVVLALFFLYFLSFLTGAPALELTRPDPASGSLQDQPFYDGEVLRPGDGESVGDASGSQREDGEFFERVPAREESRDDRVRRLVWTPGLVERVVSQAGMLRALRDPLLESDARPDRLMRLLERTYTSDLFLLVTASVWCALLLLLLPAYLGRYWFYFPMSAIVFGLSALAALLVLLTIRYQELNVAGLRDDAAWQMLLAALETGLLLLGGGVAISRTLPVRRAELPEGEAVDGIRIELRFMGHLRRAFDPSGGPTGFGDRLRSALHIAVILAAGVAVANFLLLPLFALQMNLPRVFALLMGAGLIGLAVFYVRSYLSVGRAQGSEAGPAAALAFLGFRFARNALFLGMVFALLIAAILIVVQIVVSNVYVLQISDLVPPPDSL